MTTNSDGPLDKRKEDGHHPPSSSSFATGPDHGCHPTHSIEWCWSDKRPTAVTCNKAQTVEDLLKRSSQFREAAGKLKNKELVIVRDGRAIGSHFPCSLIKNERLTVKHVKAEDRPKRAVVRSPRSPIKVSRELVMFHLLVKGGKNVVKIMRNPALKNKVQEVTVYAYRGEKVKHALRRDGRFLSVIFKKTCALSNISTEVNTELSNLVDGLEGKTFQIILLSKSSPPESQPSIGEDVGEWQQTDPDETCSQQSTAAQPGNVNIPKEEPQTKSVTAPVTGLLVMPGSQMMRNHLDSQFRELMKTKKAQVPKLSRIQNLFRVEYGQNAQMCKEVKTMKKLMKLSDSVCLVRTKDRALGSGFLLFGKFVLTNGHVLESVYNKNERRLTESVAVNFSYESLDDVQEGQVEVEEIVGFEFQPGVSGRDWALLKLGAERPLPDGLLSHSGFLPQSGGICIIGHPDSSVKKIDPCLIVQSEDRMQVVKKHYDDNQGHIQLITNLFFEGVAGCVQQYEQVLTYESCFYRGSSGSPVFDEHCRVVAMHSGGYAYDGSQGKPQSVIEFGYPLCVIIEHVVVQTVATGRFDVLRELMACGGARQRDIVDYVRNLIERYGLAKIKNAVSSSVVDREDESLEGLKPEAVPMDINSD